VLSRGRQTIGLIRTEDLEPTKDAFSLDKLNRLGKITIRAYRAKTVQKETPYFNDGAMPVVVDTVPEKLMKGRLIKNNTKYVKTELHWILDLMLQIHGFRRGPQRSRGGLPRLCARCW